MNGLYNTQPPLALSIRPNDSSFKTMTSDFTLSTAISLPEARATFAQYGRVEILDFLAPGQADTLRNHLLERADWTLVLNAGAGVYEITRDDFAMLTPQQSAELDARVNDAARDGFQYRYESVRVPDQAVEREKRNTLLDRFIIFMSSPEVLELMAQITGADDLSFADGQATAYSSGHFLTGHDDDVSGKERRAAYVFGLAPNWRAEWGGLLMFHGSDGNIEEAFAPAMGALRLFSVPCLHSVSYVTPFAPEPRVSVTGWLRAGSQGA